MAIGEVLRRDTSGSLTDFAHAATDAIEDGLALAREFETRGVSGLLPLASRLFRLGAQIYRVHQPHFLGEFVLESLSSPSFAGDREIHAAAAEALAGALEDAHRPQLFVADTTDADRRREIAHSLRDAQEKLSTLSSQLSTRSA
jgi:hypothetical protein